MSSSFQHVKGRKQSGPDRGRLERPSFSSQITTDRLRESERRSSSANAPSNMKPRRISVFREEGLDDLNISVYHAPESSSKLVQVSSAQEGTKNGKVTFDEILKDIPKRENVEMKKKTGHSTWLPKSAKGSRPMIKTSASAPPGGFPTLSRFALIVFLIALVVPGSQYISNGKQKVNIVGADAIPTTAQRGANLERRQLSQTSVCTRWSHQAANVNGTVYIYGGNSKQSAGQTSDTWNNDFFALDLTNSWQISSPSVSGLTKPSGPPAVATGSLWHSYNDNALWLYGGYFSDNPSTSPSPMSTWKYSIQTASWEEFSNPQTSVGNFSDGGGKPVQRSAEGAGLSVPEIGRAYYFGGHLDQYTTPEWSNQIYRVYLKSFLEFTFPGYANTGVESLGIERGAPREGIYRNITEGGLQDEAGFTERADGSLVYIPGWGSEGIILGLAGGTNESFTEMNIIDVYDVANSTWYKQSTMGESPPIRVNPCAIVAAAPDGSSFNIYLYGGQNLIPYGRQIQYSDMWILSIPSFTWIRVNLDGQAQPPARAGHSCVLWDAQMVVIGGYVGTNISCDSPGIYVFDTSILQWKNGFDALPSWNSGSTGGSSGGSSGSSSGGSSGPNSAGSYQDSSIMRSSFGYRVPEAVIAVIGGSPQGGATVTAPASGPATAGPIATGRPPTFTVTQSGSVVIQTFTPTATSSTEATKKRNNIGAIAAGTIAGAFALLAAYLAFCTWLYRRQLNQYKNHVAMAQRTGFINSPEPGDRSSSHSGRNAYGRSFEKPTSGGAGGALGPFGTPAANATSRGSDSRTPPSVLSPGSRPSVDDCGYRGAGGIYGGGIMSGGRGFAGLSDTDEHAPYGRPSGSTAHSSTSDLLGGMEPTFFSVMLNPRRTLRVVNSDSD